MVSKNQDIAESLTQGDKQGKNKDTTNVICLLKNTIWPVIQSKPASQCC